MHVKEDTEHCAVEKETFLKGLRRGVLTASDCLVKCFGGNEWKRGTNI